MSEAIKPTQGLWELETYGDGGWCLFVLPVVDMGVARTIASRGQWNHNIEESHANAALLLEAGTVWNTTGLTPRQLVERVKELEKTLALVADVYAAMRTTLSEKYPQDGWTKETMTLDAARAALSKSLPNTVAEVQ
ncbi:hypothetical protein [Acidovorax radicis]|uniref:hypothetical protein n=1 Tax=Acidovorax radicis TaxID=758826 RepID=UPI001CFA879E|nr:hypothetical protein [Acidovorax radicis]UCV00260.1 hypothetical protein KI609_05600 [Acidovorax radicis]